MAEKYQKVFFRKVDGFFLYGDYARNEMIKEGFDASKLHVIKNSLDYDKQLEIRNNIVASNVYKEHFKITIRLLFYRSFNSCEETGSDCGGGWHSQTKR